MKPECSEYKKVLAKSLAEDLAPGERQSFEEHLAACPDCQAERASYLRTLELMQSVEDKPVPRHFFVPAGNPRLNPWDLFRMLQPHWQVLAAAAACLFIIVSIGWATSLRRSENDVAALKKDILKSMEEKNRADRTAWLREVRAEIERSRTDLTQEQQARLSAAIARLDSKFAGQLRKGEALAKSDNELMAAALYQVVVRQRAQDLNYVNLRFNSMAANSAVKDQQVDVMLATLLQAAELSVK